MNSDKQIAYDYLLSFVGRFYKWGGDDPSGVDCSGLVVEFLQAFGVIPHGRDFSAQSLHDTLIHSPTSPIGFGSILFWGLSNKQITHVTIALSKNIMIGAEGGGSKTLTLDDAIKQNAFVKIRPIRYRGVPVATIFPNYKWE